MGDIRLTDHAALKRVQRCVNSALEFVDQLLERYPEEEENVEKVVKATEIALADCGLEYIMEDRIYELVVSMSLWHGLVLHEDKLWGRIAREGETKEKLDAIVNAIYELGRAHELASVINWGEFKKK